jgi:predicted DCC family thiol-disulfide oxidoreductase YuxK
MRYPLTIFYDASCPMCASEMLALHALTTGGELTLVDCSPQEFDAAAHGTGAPSRAAMLSRIHARDAEGRWLVGIDVFEAAYRAAGLERPARLWGHPLLKPLWRALYPLIADHRQLLSRLGVNALVRRLIPKPMPAGDAANCARCVRATANRAGESWKRC